MGLWRCIKGEHRGGIGVQKGGGDTVRLLQHPNWVQWKPGFCPLRDGPGEHLPGGGAGDKYHQRHLQKGICGVLGGGFGRDRRTP